MGEGKERGEGNGEVWESLPRSMVNVEVLILAGGLGTRLGKLTQGQPKPMMPIGEKPFLEYLIKTLSSAGFTDVVLLVGYRADRIMDYFRDGQAWGMNIRYSVESTPMGTGGALKLAATVIKKNTKWLIVLNGDSFLECDYQRLLEFHVQKKAHVTLALSLAVDRERFGSVSINKENVVTGFLEKTNTGASPFINAGVYVMNPDTLAGIPNGKACSLELEVIPQLVGNGVYGFPIEGYFVDIGLPESYCQAVRDRSLYGGWSD